MGIKNWNKLPLQQLCHRIGDGLHGTPKYATNTRLYFINGNNIKDGKVLINTATKEVTENDYTKNFIPLDKNSLLLSINGTIGNLAFYNNEKVMLGKSTAYLNFKSSINSFFYYYFQLKNIQKKLYNIATGSTIKNLSLKSIQNFKVPVPNESEWKAISSILSNLDKKIELNNQINQELENMAKLLYDYWFVQFDFPDANGKPYKSSGGTMVYNEQLKREIPLGWEVGHFGDYASVKSGFAFKSTWWQEVGVPVVKIKDIQEDNNLDLKNLSFVGENKAIKAKKFQSKAGNVIIAMTGATIGKFAIIPPYHLPLYINQRVGLYNMTDSPLTKLPYLFNSMKQDFFRLKIQQISTGAAQPNISAEQLDKLPMIFPKSNLITRYNKLLIKYYKKILNNQQQNQQLAQLRDSLLPMLMNGQVTIS